LVVFDFCYGTGFVVLTASGVLQPALAEPTATERAEGKSVAVSVRYQLDPVAEALLGKVELPKDQKV
jgi:hypothetical protein